MSVRIAEEAIWLDGRCLVEDAETLLVAIQEWPAYPVDVTGAQRLHLAVLQVLLGCRPGLRGTIGNPFLARHIFGRADFYGRQIR